MVEIVIFILLASAIAVQTLAFVIAYRFLLRRVAYLQVRFEEHSHMRSGDIVYGKFN